MCDFFVGLCVLIVVASFFKDEIIEIIDAIKGKKDSPPAE
jgi:hypothetical protein